MKFILLFAYPHSCIFVGTLMAFILGRGKLTDKDGNVYEGDFHNNKWHGEGRFWASDGSEYEGGFVCGIRHGHGVMKMADGSVFEVSISMIDFISGYIRWHNVAYHYITCNFAKN